jgi:GT2 family glycosyltransferase
MNERLPLVSIVTPVYNGARFIAETVESVLAQEYPRLEYRVLDDGSTDGTLARLAPYRGRVEVRSHPNMGESRTVNEGLRLAQGELICVVNADDPLRPGAIARAVEAYRADPEALAFYPDWAEIDAESRVIRDIRLPEFDIASMLGSFIIAMGPGVFINRRALALVGLRNTELRYTGDLDYWFRTALHGRLVHLPEVLATHRRHTAAASSTQQGELMAREVVGLAERSLADPRLDPHLKAQSRAILARAHIAASFHAGALRVRARYLARALALSLPAFAGMALRLARRRLLRLLHA